MPTNREDWTSALQHEGKDPSDSEQEMERVKSKLQPHGSLTSQDSEPQVMTVKPNLKSYIGTKVILARPMTETEFLITVKGKSEEVTYEDNYISWSPKRVFERCYREITQQEGQMVYTANCSPKK